MVSAHVNQVFFFGPGPFGPGRGMFPRVFGDEFGDKFSELLNLVIILVMNLVMNLVNCQIR